MLIRLIPALIVVTTAAYAIYAIYGKLSAVLAALHL